MKEEDISKKTNNKADNGVAENIDGKSTPQLQKKSRRPDSVSKIKALQKKMNALQQERDTLREQLLRKAAEFENYKKRRENDFIQLIANSNAELISQLLPIVDDYERSLKSARESKDFGTLYEGVELIYKNLLSVLDRQGVKPIGAVGEVFDPELHEALMQIDSDKHESGVVVDEHLKGYRMHDKVLRHAQVIVSK